MSFWKNQCPFVAWGADEMMNFSLTDKGAVALRKKCGSLFLISKYPTTQKPDSKEPGFCCKIQLCH